MKSIFVALFFLTVIPCFAGVYDTLEFGDSRETVTSKLQKSKLVTQTIATTLMGRTGLNGVFKTKSKLAGLSYQLYFDWDEHGGLREITLRSDSLPKSQYSSTLYKSWVAASQLFTQVYKEPAQNSGFPDKMDVVKSNILMSHLWHQGPKQTILMGPGIDKEECFLAIRFLNQHIEPVKIESK